MKSLALPADLSFCPFVFVRVVSPICSMHFESVLGHLASGTLDALGKATALRLTQRSKHSKTQFGTRYSSRSGSQRTMPTTTLSSRWFITRDLDIRGRSQTF